MKHQIDYSLIKSEYLSSWREIYDDSKSFPENILEILHKVVLLPSPFQYRLLASYSLLPSALCNILPVLIFYGQKGTGKSNTGEFISYLHNCPINTGADTFAALRNDLNKRRWGNIQIPSDDPAFPGYRTKKIELNTMMIWDDIDIKKMIEEPNIFRMLKSGYNRATDAISIADSGGKNLKFNCFSPKICSSVSPIWGDPKYTELERRILVIEFGRAKKDVDLIRLEEYDFSGFNELFNDYWNDLFNVEAWLKNKKLLSKVLRNSTTNTIWLDILTTGLSCDIFQSPEDCLNYVEHYNKWYQAGLAHGDSALCGLLKEYIEKHLRGEAEYASIPIFKNDEISPIFLKRKISEWQNEGMLEAIPNPKLIADAMNYLGWKLIPGKWVRMK